MKPEKVTPTDEQLRAMTDYQLRCKAGQLELDLDYKRKNCASWKVARTPLLRLDTTKGLSFSH
jgi:hypothetical protein